MTRREALGALAAGGALCASGRVHAMEQLDKIRIVFIAGFGPIVRDAAASRRLYRDVLGIQFKEEGNGYLHIETMPGANSFALWSLSNAAQSCFGRDSWPEDLPVPQAWLEFEVDSVAAATAELESQGYRMLLRNKLEPWGQTVSRLLSPEGLLAAVTFTPAMRERK